MLNPVPPPPEWLREIVEPWSLRFNLPALADHFHEVVTVFIAYLFIHYFLSPWLSPKLFPRHYPSLNKRTKLNWDVHVVSLIQSTFINAVALWVLFTDDERKSMTPGERVLGYTGSCALISSLAVGYFIYDLLISTIYVKIFGIGMLFHAISALWVFSFGFRPFVNYYAPVFILYELSSPFLNIHWFLDKVNMTGSSLQWYNGMALLVVFFFCRLFWGTWQSVIVYKDMFAALGQTWAASSSPLTPVDITAEIFQARDGGLLCINEACVRANAEITKYAKYTASGIPTWLVVTYVTSNLILNGLNYYWFSKMIETVMKRFRPSASAPKQAPAKETKNPTEHNKENSAMEQAVFDAATELEQEECSLFLGDDNKPAASGVDAGLSDVRNRKA